MRGIRIWRCVPHALAWVCLAAGLSNGAAVAAGRAPGFDRVPIRLPGIPAAIFPADLNGDGSLDLAVVVAYNEWADVAEFEQTTFDGVEGMVEVMNVVTSWIDRRELRVYLGAPDRSGYRPPLPVLELDTSIHAFAVRATGAGDELIALTDEGLSAVRLRTGETPSLAFEALVEQPNAYSGDERFYPHLDFLHDLNGDEDIDAILPTRQGWAIVSGTGQGFSAAGISQVAQPTPRPAADDGFDAEGEEDREAAALRPRLPEVRDLNCDGLNDLVFLRGHHDFDGEENEVVLYRNLGDFGFAPVSLRAPTSIEAEARSDDDDDEDSSAIVFAGPLEVGECSVAVARSEVERWQEPTVRQEIDAAKRPLYRYTIYDLHDDLSLAGERGEFEAFGYSFEGSDAESDQEEGDDVDIRLPGGFQDLDGDGRLDLVSINLDFSILPLLTRVLVTQSIKLRMDFQVTCQAEDGGFAAVPGLDLSGRFKINLRKAKIRHLSQFAGDFDGDGRADFVQLGRGKKVTIHHGRSNCRYPAVADQTIVFEKKPEHLGLVRVLDLNGDERSDIYVVHPLEKPRKERATPVRVDIYLSQAS